MAIINVAPVVNDIILAFSAMDVPTGHINKCFSSDFAKKLAERLGSDAVVMGTEKLPDSVSLSNCFGASVVDRGSMPVHAWVLYNGKHYDSESACGVNDPLELPIFRRAARKLVRASIANEKRKKEGDTL